MLHPELRSSHLVAVHQEARWEKTKCWTCPHLFMATTETEAAWDDSADLPLPVLLANAVVRRQPGQRSTQVVVVGLPHDEQPPRNLHRTQSPRGRPLRSSGGDLVDSLVLPVSQQVLVPQRHRDHHQRCQAKSVCCGSEGSHPAQVEEVVI